MDESGLVTFVSEKIVCYEDLKAGHIRKWSTFVDGKDGFLYGIPDQAVRVVKFSPVDKSMEMIGPTLEGCELWMCGVLAKNGCIYCPPADYNKNDDDGKMLKVNTNDGTVVTFDIEEGLWRSGALGADNCIYYMPWDPCRSFNRKHILRVDPCTDAISYISLLGFPSFIGTVLGKDNCIYGLPDEYSSDLNLMRFDPMEPENESCLDFMVPDERESMDLRFETDGVLGNDGHIYALNFDGWMLKVDTSAHTITSIGRSPHPGNKTQPIIGLDQCIYWPPENEKYRVLKFDLVTQSTCDYGPDYIDDYDDFVDWSGGALASDGVIYCAPLDANRVLAIDPLRELSITMRQKMFSYPDELGRLFVQNDESYSESLFESAVRKFGFVRALRLLDERLPSDDEWAERHISIDSVPLVKLVASGGRMRKRSFDSVPLFVLAASGGRNGGVGDVPLSVIYHLVRRNVHGLLMS